MARAIVSAMARCIREGVWQFNVQALTKWPGLPYPWSDPPRRSCERSPARISSPAPINPLGVPTDTDVEKDGDVPKDAPEPLPELDDAPALKFDSEGMPVRTIEYAAWDQGVKIGSAAKYAVRARGFRPRWVEGVVA